jgi:hypothetical protein
MFKTVRTIHLCAAAFSIVFLVMYSISAVQMAHSRWFDIRPKTAEQTLTLAPGLTDARIVARDLISQHGVRGDLRSVEVEPGRLKLQMVRPGTVYQIDYAAADGRVEMKMLRSGWLGMLNRLHHSEGIWHEYWPINAWAAMAGVISIGLFTLGISGLYLWFRTRRERWIGAVLAAFAAGLTLPLIISMRWF